MLYQYWQRYGYVFAFRLDGDDANEHEDTYSKTQSKMDRSKTQSFFVSKQKRNDFKTMKKRNAMKTQLCKSGLREIQLKNRPEIMLQISW